MDCKTSDEPAEDVNGHVPIEQEITMSTSTTKKLAIALLGAAALVTFGTAGNALAGGFKNMKFEHERHFHFGHWGRDRFNYGGECFLVVKPWGIEKICPDYDDGE